MRLVEQWRELESSLPERWEEARLSLTIDDGAPDRAAALLGPVNPGRAGEVLRFSVRPGGGAASREGVRRVLARLDRERIAGRLELVAVEQPQAAAPAAEGARQGLAEAWDAALAKLPSDWSDALAEMTFRSPAQIERAALLMAPLNPDRPDARPALRFRCARTFGYGASTVMVRRCLERCDAEAIRATVSVLWALSDTRPVGTQGPVWYVGGKTV